MTAKEIKKIVRVLIRAMKETDSVQAELDWVCIGSVILPVIKLGNDINKKL
jgi:hypothetical protein